MPTYAYRCRDCGHQFDIFQKFTEDPLTECPVCAGAIRRVIQPTGVVFKGTGFYINDSKSGSASKGGGNAPKDETGSPGDKPAAAGSSKEGAPSGESTSRTYATRKEPSSTSGDKGKAKPDSSPTVRTPAGSTSGN